MSVYDSLFGQMEGYRLIVGYEPYLSSLISEIISDANTSSHLVLKKAGLAKIRITSQDAQTMHGVLLVYYYPRIKMEPIQKLLRSH